MPRQIVTGEKAPKPAGPYSPAVRWDRLVFTAGQVGADAGKPVEGGIREQTRQTLTNLKNVLEAAGTDLQHVLKTTCFLGDIGDFAVFNEVYREFFTGDPPARSTIQAQLVPPYIVEVEAIAVIGDD
jgi:2-iminobutanoate/2-iminopropanoate deaminase